MYKRFENPKKLTKSEKIDLLSKYNEYYDKLIKEKGIEQLNVKIPRNVFKNALEKIGVLLFDEAEKLLEDETVKLFLDNNPLPDILKDLLPDNFRVFSLLLNSLKQWVNAESRATDRYLMGGRARDLCRSVSTHCLVTNEVLGNNAELHHPMRDGRPTILLSKNGHSKIEEQQGGGNTTGDPIWERIKELRSKRNISWKQLAEGCNALLGNISELNCRRNAKSFANKVIKETELSAEEILILLITNGVYNKR